jgi:hypothetical protein
MCRCLIKPQITLALLLAMACSREDDDWAEARRRDTPIAYSRFLMQHPETRYRREARDRIEGKSWEVVAGKNTTEAFLDYLDGFPFGEHVPDAKDGLEALAWAEAQKDGTAVAFKVFQDAFPKSRHVASLVDHPGQTKEGKVRSRPRAEVVGESPEEVSSNGRGWSVRLRFKEKGGKLGFRLRNVENYVVDAEGERRKVEFKKMVGDPGGGLRGASDSRLYDIRVSAGGEAETVPFSLEHITNWVGGHLVSVWIGSDDARNDILMVEKVRLAGPQHDLKLTPK